MDLIKVAEEAFSIQQPEFPKFKSGDTITVSYKIKEGNRERVQIFEGFVLKRQNGG